MSNDNNSDSQDYKRNKSGLFILALVLMFGIVTGLAYFFYFPDGETEIQTSTLTNSPASDVKTSTITPKIVVYKSPTCGCCTKWVDHLRQSGFEVESHDRDDMNRIKLEFGISRPLQSCHTALVEGYTIEGHVPAEDIKRLLQKRPTVAGLTVPGMPIGSPGMEANRMDPYNVLTFDKQGNTEVFTEYRVDDTGYTKTIN